MKRLSLLACALAAGAGLWWLAQDARRDASRDGGRDARPADGRSPEPSRPVARAGGTWTPERLDPPGSPGSPERSAVPAVEPPPPDGVTIAVVARGPGTPVPGALGSCVDEPDVTEGDGLDAGEGSVDALVGRFARRFRTDGEGIVVVPRPRGAGLVTAETEELWGLLMLSEDDLADLRLELDPDPPLAVRVVDEDGAPVAGVPVALRQDLGAAVTDVLIAETDASGTAALRHVRPTLERIEAVEGPRPASVALAVLLAEPVERAIEIDAFPRTPVELVLPPSGSVEVRLELPDGAPAEGPRVVRMSVADRAAQRQEHVEALTDSGRAVFDHVGLGLELGVGVHAGQGSSRRELGRRASGPRSPGERVVVRVTLDETLLVGRAVDPGGAPLVRTLLQCTQRVGARLERDDTWTDGTGRFRLHAGRNRRADGWDGRFELRARSADGSDLAARIAVPTLRSGENPLGEVVLAPPPLIAAGTVLDASGEPASGAHVLLAWNGPDRTAWDQRDTTDALGRFELRGFLEADRVRLLAMREPTLPSKAVEADRGASDVLLQLSGAGRIAGRLLLHESVHPDRLRVEAISETSGARAQAPGLERDGSFGLLELAPDTYRVLVQLHEEPECQVLVDGVVVRPGETSTDERLGAIDLRDRFRAFSLRVFDATNAPVMQGRIRRKPAGVERWRPLANLLHEGRLDIVTCAPALDIEIDSAAHRIELLRGVAADRSVYLRAGPRVRLVLAGEIPPLPSDARLTIQLAAERGDHAGRWTRQGRRVLGPDGRADFQLQDPGFYRVLVHLVRGDAPGVVVSEHPQDVIDVRDVDERQTFELRLSPATLQRLREER